MALDLAEKYPETGWWLYTERWTKMRLMPTGEVVVMRRRQFDWKVDAPVLCRHESSFGTLIGISDGNGLLRAILYDPKTMVLRSTLSRQEVREIPPEIPKWEGPQVSSRSKVGSER